MSVQIEYTTPDGLERIERDEWHNEREGYVTALDNPDTPGVERKVIIPKERVVSIRGVHR